MKMPQFLRSAVLAALAALIFVSPVSAAEIQVITSGAFAEALKSLAPEYRKTIH
ncbi:hypothetical protein [Polynucleobacter sp. QLW-P1DATA-2]|uniref:hypothetical protein n=1 Tax=Polynucleobacter sp. QLW-P1DATA-2 TaxID=1743167 RepID=UPI003518E1DA